MDSEMSWIDQSGYEVRCEWGMHALEHLAPADVIIIVDVLSFTTCVDVAVSRGATIYPYRWNDEQRALRFANENQSQLASHRAQAGARFTLSPASMRRASSSDRIVLPSPNGSALSFRAADSGAQVYAGCLRNSAAVALDARRSGASTINVIPAGERWPDGSIRFAVEDWLGTGAIVSHLTEGSCSPEAQAAREAFSSAFGRLEPLLKSSCSGRELIERGFAEDVEMASAFDSSTAVPMLRDGRFIDAVTFDARTVRREH